MNDPAPAIVVKGTQCGAPVHALVLTLNEAIHIRRCIESVLPYCASVLVVDSGSTDETREIAATLGAEVIVNPFRTHAGQVNAGIAHLAGRGGWIFRIDADEVLETPLDNMLIAADDSHAGLLIRRRIFFLGRRIRHGGLEPNWQMRLWREGAGTCEQRWMDEHVAVQGKIAKSTIELSDINLNSIGWWTLKHNNYASREAIEMLDRKYGFLVRDTPAGDRLHGSAQLKRAIKNNIYGRLPSGARSSIYFFYRYVLRLGVLDGGPGYYFHFLQAFWYRTLVDAKISEIERHRTLHNGSWAESIRAATGIDIEA